MSSRAHSFGPLLLLTLALAFVSLPASAQAPATNPPAPQKPRGVSLSAPSGLPELHFDGAPFFPHAATFPYPNIPRDLWPSSLDSYRALGINTIDISIPWNHHQPAPGPFDFTGATNPRRDLRSLLLLIAERGFKLIVRPGPVLGPGWRNGGYPAWLLAAPEYNMDPLDRIAGSLPPLTLLAATDPEAAAAQWLANSTHIAATRQWLSAVRLELALYTRRQTVPLLTDFAPDPKSAPTSASGPLLALYLDSPLTCATACSSPPGPHAARYFSELRTMLDADSLGALIFLSSSNTPPPASATDAPLHLSAQWFLGPPSPATPGATPSLHLSDADVFSLTRLASSLSSQSSSPPLISDFQAGWHAPANDTLPPASLPENSALAAHILLACGISGLTWSPLQDSLTPAGAEPPGFNRHIRWDASLNLNSDRQVHARSTVRVSNLLALWGPFLASSHIRADFAIIATSPSDPALARIERLALLAGLTSSIVSPANLSPAQLQRFPLLLFPVSDAQAPLPDSTQTALLDYVRTGGSLAFFPQRPAGEILAPLFAAPPAPANENSAAAIEVRPFGDGRVLFSSKDFYSWFPLDESFSASRDRFEADFGLQSLREFLTAAGVRPTASITSENPPPTLLFSQRIANSLASSPTASIAKPIRAPRALLNVANLSNESVEAEFSILSPLASQKSSALAPSDFLSLPVRLSARQALSLPVSFPLCAAAKPEIECDDELLVAGAELLRVERDKHILELLFFVPTRAFAVFRLERQPARVELENDFRINGEWTPASRTFRFEIPRGAFPNFLRLVRIHLRHIPAVNEKPKPPKDSDADNSSLILYYIVNAMRFPFGENSWLRTSPPLVSLTEPAGGDVIVHGYNASAATRSLDIDIRGPLRGSESRTIYGGLARLLQGPSTRTLDVRVRPVPGTDLNAPFPSILYGDMQVKAGRAVETAPIGFLPTLGARVASYQFDFDRDGFNELVLESSALRAVTSPQEGGRLIALVDTAFSSNLISHLGFLRDSISFPDRDLAPLFSLPAQHESLTVDEKPTLRFTYTTPEFSPVSASVEKSLLFDSPTTLLADYSISLRSPATPQTFTISNSVPAIIRGEEGTQFCYPTPGAAPSDFTCTAFEPNAPPLTLPEGATRLEVRTPGTFTLALEWATGSLTVHSRSFSASLELSFSLTPQTPTTNRLRFSSVPIP